MGSDFNGVFKMGFFIALTSRIVQNFACGYSACFLLALSSSRRINRRLDAFSSLTHDLLRRSLRAKHSFETKKKETHTEPLVQFGFLLVAEMGFEPHDLRVMSPTSYQTAPLRDIWCRKPGSNRYEKLISRDFKSRASANSAIPASMRPWFLHIA